ncbi:G8 domain-containing protein, partial [Alkalibacterium sp. m-11]
METTTPTNARKNLLDIKYAIFTDGNIVLKNSAQVKGDVAAKSVDIGNSAKILGDVDLKLETKYEEFIFPDIPLNDSKEKIEIPNSGRYTINSSASYREIDIKNSGVLTIDASNSDILLNVRKLTVGNSGKVIIKGSNKVTFYLEDTNWNNSSSLTYESRGIDTATVDIYHYGNKKIDLGNRVELSFNL